MKSRLLNSVVVMAIFVVLAIPTTIAAQTEQEQHNNQPVLKNLDTLEDTNTIAECIGDPSTGIADIRPDANTLYLYGRCGIDPSTNKLSGFCRVPNPLGCSPGFFDPQKCPVSARPLYPNGIRCGRGFVTVDVDRRCN